MDGQSHLQLVVQSLVSVLLHTLRCSKKHALCHGAVDGNEMVEDECYPYSCINASPVSSYACQHKSLHAELWLRTSNFGQHLGHTLSFAGCSAVLLCH